MAIDERESTSFTNVRIPTRGGVGLLRRIALGVMMTKAWSIVAVGVGAGSPRTQAVSFASVVNARGTAEIGRTT
ncbi:MAG: hypothetical protein QOJ59_928 [Thermomicrobiales bacterium]|nr:hypothetical protein [Thermomicrobiales bacterium]